MKNQRFSEWIDEFGKRVQVLRSKMNVHELSTKVAAPFPLHELHTAQQELNAAEEELRMQNEELRAAYEHAGAELRRYQELFEFAHDGYLVTDSKATILEANQAAGRMLNIAPGYLKGKPLIRFLGGDNQGTFRTEVRLLHHTCASSEMTVRIEPRQAPSFYASLRLSAMLDEGGHLVGIRWLMRDVSEPLKSQQQVQIQQEEAEQKLRETRAEFEETCRQKDETLARERAARAKTAAQSKAKDHFFAAISHELRTPLGALLSAADVLQHEGAVPEDLREFVDITHRNAALLGQLTGDLTDLAAIACGMLTLNQRQLDLHVVLNDALEVCRHEITGKSLVACCDMAAKKSLLRGDPVRLEQIFWNILRNAVKFSHARGKLFITTSNPTDGRIRVEVTDTDLGIEPAMIERIFDIFAQADTTTSRKLGGLGLGLAIARNLAEAHGGTMCARSPGKGQGATFVVELPLAGPTNCKE